jgi:hypothetical protein
VRWVCVLGGLAGLVCAGNASAQTADINQQIFDRAGNPRLVASPSPDSNLGTVSWSICLPGQASCAVAAPQLVSGRSLEPGQQPAGTTFEAAVDYAGQRTVARSSSWLGTVTLRTAPHLVGRAVIGRTVRVQPGTWSGGWGTERNGLRIQACPTRATTDCRTLSASPERPDPPDAAIRIPSRYAGWYLFAVNRRFARDDVFALADFPPSPLRPAPTVAFSAPSGPVGPYATLRQRARLRQGHPKLGTLRCPVRCNVRLTVAAPGGTYRRTYRARGVSPIMARVPQAGPGRWRITVRVNGRLAASQRIIVVA